MAARHHIDAGRAGPRPRAASVGAPTTPGALTPEIPGEPPSGTISGRLLGLISGIGASPVESNEAALRRTVLVASSLGCTLAGSLWSATYFAVGAPLAATVPLVYAVLSLASTAVFAVTRRHRLYLRTQLSLILVMPWLMSVLLGGFQASSAVIVWSSLAPFGALLFGALRNAVPWLLAFVGLVALSAAVPVPALEDPPHAEFVTLFYALNVAALVSIVFAMLAYFIHRKNVFQERSEMLLLSILPRDIAELLKASPGRIADHHEAASILFADVVGFSRLSSSMPAGDLVALLDEVFHGFDVLVERYGLEKIKTIGDCYMVASGVPHARPDHAHALAQLALAMRDRVAERRFRGRRIELRIGMNSGPVVAGVIGRKKFIYDLWGDAVNLASRMEAHGRGGVIQITSATHELLTADFVCAPAGRIEVKGKGEMEVYHLLRARPRAEPGPAGPGRSPRAAS